MGFAGSAKGTREVMAGSWWRSSLLQEDPLPSGTTKLTSFDPPAWRLRVGEYRIVYEIHEDELVVIVVNVAPRGEVYR